MDGRLCAGDGHFQAPATTPAATPSTLCSTIVAAHAPARHFVWRLARAGSPHLPPRSLARARDPRSPLAVALSRDVGKVGVSCCRCDPVRPPYFSHAARTELGPRFRTGRPGRTDLLHRDSNAFWPGLTLRMLWRVQRSGLCSPRVRLRAAQTCCLSFCWR